MKKFITGILFSLLFSSIAIAELDITKWYKIKPIRDDGKVYDVCGSYDADCTDIIVYDDNNTNNQKFKFRRTMWGTYTIHPKHTPSKVLDVEEGGDEHGTPVILYSQHIPNHANNFSRNKNQEFHLYRQGGDVYKIVNLGSGLSLGFDVNDRVRQFFDMGVSTMVELVEAY
ncbi:MAG: RICIN domain-containing protein [Oligoflexales bacterium]